MLSSRTGARKLSGKMPMAESVLDASAIIAFLTGEPGAEEVASAMAKATTSSVNLSEVTSWLSRAALPEEGIREAIDELGLEVNSFDKEAAVSAGLLWRTTRARGVSLGDRACLSLARQLGLPVLTADRNWAKLDVGVEVRLIR
jgi:ribonuclease VapC